MVAKYTVKIGDKWYKAGDELPNTESKAVSTPKEVEPPFMEEEKPIEPQKRRYTRRK